MRSARTRTVYVTRGIQAFILILIVSAALGAPAQTTRPREQSGRPAAVPQRLVRFGNAETNVHTKNLQQENGPGGPLFFPPVVYDSGGFEAGFVTVADVNGDGKLDMLVTNSYYSNTIGVLLGNGDGTFRPVATYASGGGGPIAIVPVDVDVDGKLDLVVVNQTPCYACAGDGVVAVLLGNGDGSFRAPVIYDSGGLYPGAGGFDVADLNGDGLLDVVVANCAPSGSSGCGDGNGVVGVLLGIGNGKFRSVVTHDTGISSGGTGLVLADLNRDSKPDLIVTNGCGSETCPQNVVGVLLGNGDGTFQQTVTYPVPVWAAIGMEVADINLDGKLDLVLGGCGASDCFGPNGVVTVLLGNGDGTFRPSSAYDSGGRRGDGIAVAEVNGDGKLDVLVVNTIDNSVGMLPGKGDGTFMPPLTFASGADYGRDSYSVVIADVNSDGRPDLLVSSSCCGVGGNGVVGVLINSGTFSYSRTTTTLVTSLNPAAPKQIVTYTATVTSEAGDAVTGTVRLQDGDLSIASTTLVNNQAGYSTPYKTVGVHPIRATYSGDPEHSSSSSATLTEYIQGVSKTTVTTSGSPSFVGQPVTFTAMVTSKYGTIPDGELVTFFDGATTLGSVALAGGTVALATSSLSAKTHTIKAVYGGDATFKGSHGATIQVVEKYSTTTTSTSSPNPSSFGQAVTFTARVTGTGPNAATGKVKFLDGTTGIGSATLSGGVAKLTKSTLAVGTHAITAQYLGDAVSATSSSSVLNQVVQ